MIKALKCELVLVRPKKWAVRSKHSGKFLFQEGNDIMRPISWTTLPLLTFSPGAAAAQLPYMERKHGLEISWPKIPRKVRKSLENPGKPKKKGVFGLKL